MEPEFVTGEPALLINSNGNRALIVSDLHIGIEYEYYLRGMRIPSQTKSMVNRLDTLIESTKADRLVIIGDIKHRVPGISKQELREIPEFFRHFVQKVKVDFVPGNHDGGLKDYIPKAVKIHKSSGFKIGDIFLLHGHSWPAESFAKAMFVVTGHNHPQIEFRNKLGYRWSEPVWLRAKLNKKVRDRYKKDQLPELINMPCFNKFAGGMALNKKGSVNGGERRGFLGPLIKNIKRNKARIYMVDGVFLGELGKL